MIGTNGERERERERDAGKSVLAARLDDDEIGIFETVELCANYLLGIFDHI